MIVRELIAALQGVSPDAKVSAFNSDDNNEFDVHAVIGRRGWYIVLSSDAKEVSVAERILHDDNPEDDESNCTCETRFAGPTDVDPPEGKIRDRNCPVHGIDPDRERDRIQDDGR